MWGILIERYGGSMKSFTKPHIIADFWAFLRTFVMQALVPDWLLIFYQDMKKTICIYLLSTYSCYSLMDKKTEKSILKFFIYKKFKKQFYFLPIFYLVMSLVKAQKNFGKISILKIWELISLGGAKTHFGKIALK